MIRISRSVLAVGATLLAAGLITFTNPKAVHAVAAALVQVTNTAANPVVTQSVGPQAGNMVHLTCELANAPGHTTFCFSVSPAGVEDPASYTVPAGQSLVITAADLTPAVANCPSFTFLLLSTDGLQTIFRATTLNSIATTHFTYPSGVVVASGTTPLAAVTTPSCNAMSLADSDFYGYLTAS